MIDGAIMSLIFSSLDSWFE